MVDDMLFARRLRAARARKAQKLGFGTARGYSQERLGIDAGIEEQSASARINQYEQGKHIPDLLTASRLADCLDIPMAYLFCPEDDLAELLLAAYDSTAGQRHELTRLAIGMVSKDS